MIYLGATRPYIADVADEWRNKLYAFLFDDRDKKVWVTDGKSRITKHDTYHEKMLKTAEYHETKGDLTTDECEWVKKELNYFKTKFDTIVKAGETELKRQVSNYNRRAKRTTAKGKDEFKALMVDLYERFTQSDCGGVVLSHYFFGVLNIKTCPYCNRQYTFTLNENEAKAAPEYDHFFDKSDFPMLAVSFYNLVPSCHVCNHVKGNKKTVKVNPFFRGFESKFYLYDKKIKMKRLNALEILSQGDGNLELKKADESESNADKGNIKAFGLKNLYAMHDDYVKEIIEKAAAYNKTARQMIADTFQKRGYSPDQVFDFVWGKFLDDAQYENRPLSKLTKDLLEQLEIRK